MKVVFRVDASIEIGSGHLMRCLSLAEALRAEAHILFVCRFLQPSLKDLLLSKNHELRMLPCAQAETVIDDLDYSHWLGVTQRQDVIDTIEAIQSFGACDWLVIDHYGLDYRFETSLRSSARSILVIDDLADRNHDCDILVDQNPYADMAVRYLTKVPNHCICLLGTRYCFLRDEFLHERNRTSPRTGEIRSILIYFGGVDNDNCTLEALEVVLAQAASRIASGLLKVNVVVGSMHPTINNIMLLCNRNGIGFHVQTREISRLMSEADLALGAGGISTYERLYLRLPSLVKPAAFNQVEPLRFMATLGYLILYEDRRELKNKLHEALFNGIVSPPDCVRNGLPEIVRVMREGIAKLQRPSPMDIRRTFKWLQDEVLCSDFMLSDKPVRSKHLSYWRNILTAKDQYVFSVYHEGKHVGNCGLKNIDKTNSSAELWIYLAVTCVRGKGVGKAAVKKLQRICREDLDIKTIYLHVSKVNLVAIRLYQNTGFVESNSRLLSPWENRDENIQKMECIL